LKHILKNTLAILTPKERRRLGMLIILDICISIADILFLALLLFIIHFYTEPAGSVKTPFLLSWLSGYNSVLPILVFFLLFSAKNLAGFLSYRAQCRYLCIVASRISEHKLSAYLEGPYTGYINVDSSVNVREISHDPSEFAQHVLGGIQQIITQSVLILLSIIAIVFFNAKLFLLLFVILLPPVFAVFYFVKAKRRSVKNDAKTSSEKSLQHLQEALTGFIESNIYRKNDVFLDRYMTRQKEFNNYISNQLIVQGIPSRMIEIFALLGVVILIMINRWSGTTDSSAVITIGVFMAAAYKIIPGIVKILSIGGQINTYSFTVANLVQDSSLQPPKQETVPVSALRSVRFSNVRFFYGSRLVLDKLDMSLAPGDFLGISGDSGKGKTTILNLLLGFLTPDAGEISMNDTVCDTQQRQQYWQRIAYVKQQPFLLHDTILNNITLDGKPGDEQKLQEAIKQSGLTALVDSFPEKWNKLIAENGKNISGGQKQRIAIARALYKEADLILLDEPFNELDEASESSLLSLFRDLAQSGKTIVLITHNRQSLSSCTKILSLDGEPS
jgi:ABC-type multidrug transport system fused ATPase/permease subunit